MVQLAGLPQSAKGSELLPRRLSSETLAGTDALASIVDSLLTSAALKPQHSDSSSVSVSSALSTEVSLVEGAAQSQSGLIRAHVACQDHREHWRLH